MTVGNGKIAHKVSQDVNIVDSLSNIGPLHWTIMPMFGSIVALTTLKSQEDLCYQ